MNEVKRELDEAVRAWLARIAASESPPPSVVAFNIGLFETADGYEAYLAAADRYDAASGDWACGDWACEESFRPRERYASLAIAKSEMSWEDFLAAVAESARRFLGEEGAASFFARAQAVTVGFDGGKRRAPSSRRARGS